MIPCLSPGGTNLFILREPVRRLLVATSGGVFCLEGDARLKEWRILGRALPEFHIHALLWEVSSGLVFAGIHNGTVYASDDFGKSWERKDKGITQPNVYTLSAAKLDGIARLYAGTEPAHLFLSEDIGGTWKELPALRNVPSAPNWNYPQPPYIAHVKQISFDPKEPNTLYLCVEQGALLHSRDAGLSWEELHGFYVDVHRLAILASDPRKMYLACGDGLYSTADAGASWERLTSRSSRIGYPDGLVVHPSEEKLLFISGAATIPPMWAKHGTANSCVGRSRDGGRTWNFSTTGFPPNYRGNIEALTMVVCGSSYFLFAGTTEGDVFLSDDEGENWSVIARALPAVAKRRHHLYMKPA